MKGRLSQFGWRGRILATVLIASVLIGAWLYWEVTSFDRRQDPGPLRLSDMEVTLLNRTDVLVSFNLTNEAPNKLYEIRAGVSTRVIPVDGNFSRTDRIGRIVGGEGPTAGPQRHSVFEESDIIPPGSKYNVTRLARFTGDILDGDTYQVSIYARYQDIRTEWYWSYYACTTSTGGKSDYSICDYWSIGIPYEIPGR